jgi:hypothetical protein
MEHRVLHRHLPKKLFIEAFFEIFSLRCYRGVSDWLADDFPHTPIVSVCFVGD